MAKGQASKDSITQKILEMFPGSFVVDKAIRIPMIEDNTPIQIKVALTAAKDIVEVSGVASNPVAEGSFPAPVNAGAPVTEHKKIEATEEEKANVQKMIESLGL